MLHKAWNSKEEMPYCFPRSSIKFQGHTGQDITDFDPNSAFPDYRPVAAFKSLRFALFRNEIIAHVAWKHHCTIEKCLWVLCYINDLDRISIVLQRVSSVVRVFAMPTRPLHGSVPIWLNRFLLTLVWLEIHMKNILLLFPGLLECSMPALSLHCCSPQLWADIAQCARDTGQQAREWPASGLRKFGNSHSNSK